MADTVPLATPRTTLACSHRSYGLVERIWTGMPTAPWPMAVGAAVATTGRRVAPLLDDLGDPARPARRGGQEVADLEDAALELLEAEFVDDPLESGPQLVVAVAGLLEHPQDRLDRRQQVFLRGEVLERERGVRVGAEAAGDEHPEALLDLAVVVACGSWR